MSDDVLVAWRSATFDGTGLTPFYIDTMTGWVGVPGASYQTQDSSRGHGVGVTAGVQGPRVVMVTGRILADRSARDSLVDSLRMQMIPRASTDLTTDPLTVTIGGRTYTAQAQLQNFAVDTVATTWSSGGVPWKAQWRCPDPRVFGPTITATSLLVTSPAGIDLPAMMPFLEPEKPIGGTVSLNNTGNDPEGSPAVITLTGAQSGSVGVTNVTTGAVLTYALGLATIDVLVVDTDRGGAFLNGEYRPPTATSDVTADLAAAPGVNVYRALGSAGAGSPSITVAVRPRSW